MSSSSFAVKGECDVHNTICPENSRPIEQCCAGVSFFGERKNRQVGPHLSLFVPKIDQIRGGEKI